MPSQGFPEAGLDEVQCRTHMAMWCMMNSPLMLGLDLRRVEKGDWIWKIIANKDLIALNQDALGIQAKRILCLKDGQALADPDTSYIRDPDRVDVLAKPLSDGSVALSFINISENRISCAAAVKVDEIVAVLKEKMVKAEAFAHASSYCVTNLWTGERSIAEHGIFAANVLTQA